LEAIHSGHVKIGNNQVILTIPRHLKSLNSVYSQSNVGPDIRETLIKQIPDGLVVVNNQYSSHSKPPEPHCRIETVSGFMAKTISKRSSIAAIH